MGKLIEEYIAVKKCRACAETIMDRLWTESVKYHMLQDECTNLKADMVAMLEELQLEIEELDSRAGYDGCGMPTFSTDYIRKKKVNEVIQQKIDALKGN